MGFEMSNDSLQKTVATVPKIDCTGCGACVATCPINAIAMVEDTEGFPYPVINVDNCIRCGKCRETCGALRSFNTVSNNLSAFAATLRKTEDLNAVSSGGAFWGLSQTAIEKGGVVYGAARMPNLSVNIARADSIESAKRFRGSKYQQSFAFDAFREAKADLNEGRLVLFSGVPCQIGGLRLYLGSDYPNLITCDVVCHGIPSNKAFTLFCEETKRRNGSKIVNINCRDKSLGWKSNCYSIEFENGSVTKQESKTHPFHKCYLNGLMYRPSCEYCRYANLQRVSDITLADFWQYQGNLLNLSQGLGVSLVVCSSEKGKAFLKQTEPYLHLDSVEMKEAVASCRHLTKPPQSSPHRNEFLHAIDSVGFHGASQKYAEKRRALQTLKRALSLLKKHVEQVMYERSN